MADLASIALNRAFGLATIWALAVFGYQFITNKLVVQKEQWLQTGKTLSVRLSQLLHGLDQAPSLTGTGTFRLPELFDAADKVMHEPPMLSHMLSYLTVQVSEMFRDPDYFQCAPAAGHPGFEDVSVDQSLGGGMQHG